MSTSFAKMLRYSKFVQLGDFRNRVLIADIVHRVGEDLYVDMGLKFNAVCRAPPTSAEPEKYVIGAKVLVQLHDPELSERFLGSKHDLTLLEADATILALHNTPKDNAQQQDATQDERGTLMKSSGGQRGN